MASLRARHVLGAALVTTALLAPLGATAASARPGAHPPAGGDPRVADVLVPIGGGYETDTLEAFARTAAARASGPTVDLVVVPSAYGDAPEDRAENLELAGERTEQLRAACESAVPARFTGCTARLAVLLDRADALDPANATALADPATDGIFVLGGDQGLAMQVLAASPAERAVSAATRRGVVLGGTSAGAAVESRSMINGYAGDLGPAEGLRRGSTLLWWGDDADLERGLDTGSRRAIYDQHFHQRGRLGRTLSTLATADEHFRGASPVGVGVDYGTGVRATDDRLLSGVFGQGSVSVVDLETLRATHTWGGAERTLSARRVLTHLLTEGQTYDLGTRTLTRLGHVVRPRGRRPGGPRRPPGAARSSWAVASSAPPSSPTSSTGPAPCAPTPARASSCSPSAPTPRPSGRGTPRPPATRAGAARCRSSPARPCAPAPSAAPRPPSSSATTRPRSAPTSPVRACGPP